MKKLIALALAMTISLLVSCQTSPADNPNDGKPPHDPYVIYVWGKNINPAYVYYLSQAGLKSNEDEAKYYIAFDLTLTNVKIETTNNTFECPTYINIKRNGEYILHLEVTPEFSGVTNIGQSIPCIGGDEFIVEYDCTYPTGAWMNNKNNIFVSVIFEN